MFTEFFPRLKVYIRLDQPMAALEVYRTGSDRFPGETSLLTGIARIYEGIGNLSLSAKYYKLVLRVIVRLFFNIREKKLNQLFDLSIIF